MPADQSWSVPPAANSTVSSPSRHSRDLFGRHGSRPKHSRRRSRQVEDGRFQAEVGRPAVEDQVDPAVQVGQDVLGRVGETRFERLALGAASGSGVLDQAAGDARGRHSHATVSLAGRHEVGDQGRSGQDEGQWSGPEPLGQSAAVSGQDAAQGLACSTPSTWTIRGLNEGRPLASKIRATAGRVGGDRAQSVDGLGGEGDQAAASQDVRGLVEQAPRAGGDRIDLGRGWWARVQCLNRSSSGPTGRAPLAPRLRSPASSPS